MKDIVFSIVLGVFISTMGCTSKKEELKQVDFEEKEIKDYEQLDLYMFEYKGEKLVLSKEKLLKQFGEPDTIFVGGAFQPEKQINEGNADKSTLKKYQSYLYDSFKFAVWDSKAQISLIDFTELTDTIKHPKINLSSKTNINEIKQKFPASYILKNESMNSLFGLSPDEYGFKKENVEWVQFRNGRSEYYSKIELTFLNDDLIWAYFEVGE